MRVHRSRLLLSLALLWGISGFIIGCSSQAAGPEMVAVSGKVTIDGNPLSDGNIIFDPQDGKGIPVQAGISSGAFTCQVPPGMKVVRIQSTQTSSEKGPYGEDVSISIIPAQYNTNSDLTAEVKANGDAFEFDLTTK